MQTPQGSLEQQCQQLASVRRRLLAPTSHTAAHPPNAGAWACAASVESQGFHPSAGGAGASATAASRAARAACTARAAEPGRLRSAPLASLAAAVIVSVTTDDTGGSGGRWGGGGGRRYSRRCAVRADVPGGASCIRRHRSYCGTSRRLLCTIPEAQPLVHGLYQM